MRKRLILTRSRFGGPPINRGPMISVFGSAKSPPRNQWNNHNPSCAGAGAAPWSRSLEREQLKLRWPASHAWRWRRGCWRLNRRLFLCPDIFCNAADRSGRLGAAAALQEQRRSHYKSGTRVLVVGRSAFSCELSNTWLGPRPATPSAARSAKAGRPDRAARLRRPALLGADDGRCRLWLAGRRGNAAIVQDARFHGLASSSASSGARAFALLDCGLLGGGRP